MTLGGLALEAVILVDDSRVTIENTYRLLDEEKMPLPEKATLHGAAEIAVPTVAHPKGERSTRLDLFPYRPNPPLRPLSATLQAPDLG